MCVYVYNIHIIMYVRNTRLVHARPPIIDSSRRFAEKANFSRSP